MANKSVECEYPGVLSESRGGRQLLPFALTTLNSKVGRERTPLIIPRNTFLL